MQEPTPTPTLPAEQQAKKSSTSLPTEWIERLFARLSAMYGARFLDMWRDIEQGEVKKCWAQDLSCFTKTDLAKAIDRLKTKPFPPTLPEFWLLCDVERRFRIDDESRKNHILRLPQKSDPAPPWVADLAKKLKSGRPNAI